MQLLGKIYIFVDVYNNNNNNINFISGQYPDGANEAVFTIIIYVYRINQLIYLAHPRIDVVCVKIQLNKPYMNKLSKNNTQAGSYLLELLEMILIMINVYDNEVEISNSFHFMYNRMGGWVL